MPNHTKENVRISVTPRTVGIIMAAIVLVLGLSYASTKIARVLMQYPVAPELYRYFHVGEETSLPTYISALYLLFAGMLLTLITLREWKYRSDLTLYWLGLAVGFIYMSFDEATMIHDGVIDPWLDSLVGEGEGIWYFGWTRAFIPLVLIIGGLYIPFLKRISSKYAKLFILAGVVYVGGAVGIEIVGSYGTFYEIEEVFISLSIFLEEMCEMLGVVIFVYALLSYISEHRIAYQLSVHSSESAVSGVHSPRKSIQVK